LERDSDRAAEKGWEKSEITTIPQSLDDLCIWQAAARRLMQSAPSCQTQPSMQAVQGCTRGLVPLPFLMRLP
jgi:hypothetical protein